MTRRVARIVLAGQELVSTNVFNTKALCFSRIVCGFETCPLMAQVCELAEDDQACAAGVAAGFVQTLTAMASSTSTTF